MIEEYEFDDGVDGELSGMVVLAPSGAPFTVLTESEKSYFEDIASKYVDDNLFTNVSDLQDVDRIVIMELLAWRWSTWLSQELDYWGEPIDSDTVKKNLNDYSKEIRLIKKSLGLDKPARDKEKGESAADYVETLRQRARQFGIMRNAQANKSIELFMELAALVTFHDNCTQEERRENKIDVENIMDWLRQVAFPEFLLIDSEFRNTTQRYWDRSR